MNKFYKISVYLLSSLLIPGCITVEKLALDDSHQLAVEEPVEKGKPVLTFNKGVLEDFGSDIYSWWVANDKVAISRVGDTLKVVLKSAGNKYECWGRVMPMVDMTEAPVIKVRARAEGKLVPTLRVGLKDITGMDANAMPPTARVRTSSEYTDYYFNFKDKWKQSYPVDGIVDPTSIAEILFFVNPGAMDWTGTLYIDEIKAVRVEDIPVKKSASAPAPAENTAPVATETIPATTEPAPVMTEATPAPTETTPVAVTNAPVSGTLIDDFTQGIESWWSGSDKIKFVKESDAIKVSLSNVGATYETFGKGFKPIDFSKTPILKFRLKATGDKPAQIRVDVKDIDGSVTNGKPVTQRFETGTDFVEYYYDYTGKFEQSYPNVQKVNPEQIVELLFFINPGAAPYTGTLLIDDIQVMTVEDYKNKK